jgi:asparagine synthase (glutamine-hydrolysing)
MCGIAGILALGTNAPLPDRAERVRAMMRALAHRGPDDEGLYAPEDSSVALGHRRLSIIDLSSDGHQPMQRLTQVGESAAIVFNGEIYNYKSLIESEDIPNVKNDTGLLLELLTRDGEKALNKLRGFFAFAHWSQNSRELFIARDALGKKPLYYSIRNGQFIFSSELRSLMASGLIPFQLSQAGLSSYLAFYSLPAPETMIEGVSLLPAGHQLKIDAHGEIRTRRWWRLPEYSPIKIGRADAAEQVRALLEESVRYRLVSDVPVGAFLSGGIDSNVIVALMSKLTQTSVSTFTLGFDQTGFTDETQLASMGASMYGAKHHQKIISADDIALALPDFFRAMDSPTGDGLNSFIVARAARELDPALKVVLSGVGGDELFIGYKKFRWMAQHKQWLDFAGMLSDSTRHTLESKLRRIGFGPAQITNALRSVLDPSYTRVLFDANAQSRLMTTSAPQSTNAVQSTNAIQSHIDKTLGDCSIASERNPIARLQRLDYENYLPNMLLRDLDVMTMSQSLEARAPFLDTKLVEFVWSIPVEDKAQGPSKSLLVRACEDILPEAIRTKRKTGFELPMDSWLKRGILSSYRELLASADLDLVRDGHLNSDEVRALEAVFMRGEAHYMSVWSIIALEFWYRSYLHPETIGGTA